MEFLSVSSLRAYRALWGIENVPCFALAMVLENRGQNIQNIELYLREENI